MAKYIYIYAVKLLSGPSLGVLEVIMWSKFAFSKTLIAPKHYKNRDFSTFLENMQEKLEVIIWFKLAFLKRTQLGPDNNFQLGPDNNFQKSHFV